MKWLQMPCLHGLYLHRVPIPPSSCLLGTGRLHSLDPREVHFLIFSHKEGNKTKQWKPQKQNLSKLEASVTVLVILLPSYPDSQGEASSRWPQFIDSLQMSDVQLLLININIQGTNFSLNISLSVSSFASPLLLYSFPTFSPFKFFLAAAVPSDPAPAPSLFCGQHLCLNETIFVAPPTCEKSFTIFEDTYVFHQKPHPLLVTMAEVLFVIFPGQLSFSHTGTGYKFSFPTTFHDFLPKILQSSSLPTNSYPLMPFLSFLFSRLH